MTSSAEGRTERVRKEKRNPTPKMQTVHERDEIHGKLQKLLYLYSQFFN